MQQIKNENLKNYFVQIDSEISQVEVKGDSVARIYKLRTMILELFNSIEEIEEEK